MILIDRDNRARCRDRKVLVYDAIITSASEYTHTPSLHESQSAVENARIVLWLDAWALHRGAWSCREALHGTMKHLTSLDPVHPLLSQHPSLIFTVLSTSRRTSWSLLICTPRVSNVDLPAFASRDPAPRARHPMHEGRDRKRAVRREANRNMNDDPRVGSTLAIV
jgi:hypothetical protein